MTYNIRTAIAPGGTSGPELANITEEVSDLTQIVVESDTTNQPVSPAESDAYIVNGDASWGGAQYDIAVFRDSAWIYHTPEEGWVAYIKDRGESRRFNGSNWLSSIQDNSPEHATDSGTDAFVSAVNTDTLGDGNTIVRDFQSASTTTAPSLDGGTITTRDGSALWAGALSGVHTLTFKAFGSSYEVLDPNPNGGDEPASVAETLAAPGTSTDPSLAFDTWRTPSVDRVTLVTLTVLCRTDGASPGRIEAKVDESGGTSSDYSFVVGFADEDISAVGDNRQTSTFIVPAGGSYIIENTSDPQGVNTLTAHRELTL